jgi:hypothetical protein
MKEQLDQAIQKALEKVFEKWNKEKLLDCFPSIKQKSPDALERAHDAIKDYVLTNVMVFLLILSTFECSTVCLCVFINTKWR